MIEVDQKEFVLEPMYFNWKFSDTPKMFLREKTLEKVRRAKTFLPNGYNFKFWDTYRPLKVQQALWDDCLKQTKKKHPDWNEDMVFKEARKYIAIPDLSEDAPPPHSTGGTVDLTIINDNGDELNMGTKFDDFNDTAHPYYFHNLKSITSKDKEIILNRSLLFSIMLRSGFRQDIDEWWHFDYGNQLWAHDFKETEAFYGRGDKYLPE